MSKKMIQYIKTLLESKLVILYKPLINWKSIKMLQTAVDALDAGP
jgi:hypothetical protein